MHDDKHYKGYDYDAMRHHHGPEDPYDYPSHGHRHPAYDFPDVYHPVPYGKEYLGNQPIHLQDPHSGHVVHPCPPRDWGRHGCCEPIHYEPHHEHHIDSYLHEYVGLLEDYLHKDKGLDDCDCGEAIRHLRSEINALLKSMERNLKGLGDEYDSIKSKMAYYIGKTQACIQSTEEYMRRQELIGSDWEEMKAKFNELIGEWEEFGATTVLRYTIDQTEQLVDIPEIDELLDSVVSEMPTITDITYFKTNTDPDFVDETEIDEFTKVVYKYNGTTNGSYAEFTTYFKRNNTGTDNVFGEYLVLKDRIELFEMCEDRKVTNHAECWQRTEGYPNIQTLKDYAQGTIDKAIKTRMIDDGAVTSAKIANKAVTTGKLDDGAVENDKIANDAVSEAKLDANVRAKLNKDDDTKYTLTKDGSTITLTGSDGSVTSVTDKDEDHNTTYTLSKIGNTITLTGSDGTSTSVTDTDEDHNTTYRLSKSGNTITLTGSDGSTSSVTDTDEDHNTTYTLSKSGSTITLTGSDGSTSTVSDSDTEFVLEDGSVTTAKLANGAVTTAKIADDAVTYAELAPSAVRTATIQDSAVTNAKINNGAVSEEKLSTAVQTKLNRDNNTTYSLSKSGSTITLTGSDGTTSSVTDEAGSGGDGNTTYTISENNRRLTLTGSDGSTSSATITNVSGTPYDVALSDTGVFNGYLRCYKAGGLVTICTEEANTVATAFNSKQYTKICTLPSELRPTRLVDTVAIVADKLTNFRVNTSGEVFVYVFYEDAAQVPTGWHLHASLAYQHV